MDLTSFLADGLSETGFVILVVTSFAGSFITVAFGLGGGAVLLAVAATILPPAALIPVHGAAQTASNVGRVAILFRHIAWGPFPAFLIGSLVGAVLGGSLVINLPGGFVQIGVGAFIIWTIYFRAPRLFTRWPAVTGVISSFLTMFFGATGLFVAAFTRALGLPRHGFVATHAMFMTAQHALKTVIFAALGFVYAPWLPLIAAMIVAGFLGTMAGRLVLDRTTDARFKRVLEILLTLIALRLIWQGASTL